MALYAANRLKHIKLRVLQQTFKTIKRVISKNVALWVNVSERMQFGIIVTPPKNFIIVALTNIVGTHCIA